MPSKIVERICAESGLPELYKVLAERLGASDLQSLLVEVFQRRGAALKPSEARHQFEEKPLAAASGADARLQNLLDGAAYEAADGFEAVELSPVCPLGTETSLGGIDQNNLLTTIRGMEVLGDVTPALALECARRKRAGEGKRALRLCSSQRVVRLQPFDMPGFTPHFRLFGAVSAGRTKGNDAFEMEELRQHLRLYLRLFRLVNQYGFQARSPLVEVSDLGVMETSLKEAGIGLEEVRAKVRAHLPGSGEAFLAERGFTPPPVISERLDRVQREVLDPLCDEFPEIEARVDSRRLEGLGYYSGLCLRVSPTAPDGQRYAVADGGFTDWTARLLEDRKERLLTSGIGLEFLCKKYRAVKGG